MPDRGVVARSVNSCPTRIGHRDYKEITESTVSPKEEIPGIRGKLDLSETIKANLLARARTVCNFDELSPDVLHNQIIKATLRRHLLSETLTAKLREPLRIGYLRLPGVTDIRLRESVFRAVQLHRNIRFYRFLLDVCRLIFECMVPDEVTGRFRFRDFSRDEDGMYRLFERFLFNFYHHEQVAFKVTRPSFPWAQTSGTAISLLPQMRTDIYLTSPSRRILIDAKYTASIIQEYHGHRSLRAPHLYQLFSYLKNIPAPASTHATEGMLVYPLARNRVDVSFVVHGHGIRVYTIDLNQHWKSIRQDLLNLLQLQAAE
jgi:5-methylcytosine-specific restriction enzyme subunit McrC